MGSGDEDVVLDLPRDEEPNAASQVVPTSTPSYIWTRMSEASPFSSSIAHYLLSGAFTPFDGSQ